MHKKQIINHPKGKNRKVKDLIAPVYGSNLDLYPKFSLHYIQTQSKYCLSCCTKDQKASFADTIKQLSSLTWRQIFGSPRHGQGFEKINSTSLNIEIPSNVLDRKLIAFRFSGSNPMVGFMEHDTFFILWFDHDMSLYDHS